MREIMPPKRRNDKASDALFDLKKHLDSCRTCIAGLKGKDLGFLCESGSWLTIQAARQYGDTIKQRIAAHNREGGVVYPCPDLSAHGVDYAVTATACHVVGIQNSLF